jgi:hypothetical protein
MKTKYLIPVLFFVFFLGCKKEKDNKISEVPDVVFNLKPCETLVDGILGLFPQSRNAWFYNLAFFSDTIQTKIILTKECEVYVSYIAEGAGYKNTLGWYSYDIKHPPLQVTDINKHVLFPNISGKGEGGELESGYTIQLGENKFPKGTVIGFFLVVNGWNDGTINYNNETHYTNFEFNEGGLRQHVLFKEKTCHDVVLCFEDMPIIINSDKDFNDIIISITDNKDGYETSSFDEEKLIIK